MWMWVIEDFDTLSWRPNNNTDPQKQRNIRSVYTIVMASYPMGSGVKRPGREADHSPPSSDEV